MSDVIVQKDFAQTTCFKNLVFIHFSPFFNIDIIIIITTILIITIFLIYQFPVHCLKNTERFYNYYLLNYFFTS